MMGEHGQGGNARNDIAALLPTQQPVHIVTLRGPAGERRFPVDLIRDEVQPLPSATWVAFLGDDLGEPPAYAVDLLRRLARWRCPWLAQASLRFGEKPQLIKLARQSNCRALLFDGSLISQHYLSTESAALPEQVSHLTQSLRRLADNGIFSIVHFVFGYDTDDEGVFERTARFCMDA
ncbi:MAG TPA: hypothetical protein VNN62_04965, partial [Methylomirabilota bacterium]|nr:hypothetical protein [Methylomirabilota bacterium]